MADAPKPINILKPGTFTDVKGVKVTFTRADMAQIIDSYDASQDPAPLVIGHPKLDDPAFGWVGSLQMDGDVLQAVPSAIAPELAEAVREQAYRKISPSLYPPADPNNPTPGKWHLKHVGFLGAAAPAIKGLGTVSLGAGDNGAAITITFADTNSQQEQDMPDDAQTIDLAEHQAQLATLQAELGTALAALEANQAKAVEAATLARHSDHVSFAEGLVTAGKLAPVGKGQLITIMDALPVQALCFGETDEAKAIDPVAAVKALFDKAQPIVALGEHAGADKGVPDTGTPEVIAQRAVEFAESERAAGRTVSVQAAVRHVAAKAAG